MSTGLMRTKTFIFLSIILVLLLSGVSFGEEESFREILNNALKFYIERDYTGVVGELEKASLMMRNLAPLKIDVLTFCERIDMFAKYVEKKDSLFSPGETFIVYFQPANYSLKKTKEGWEIYVEEYFEIVDEKKEVVSKMTEPLVFHVTLLSPLTTGLYFKNVDFVPTKPGKYTLRVVLEDKIKGKEIKGELPFEVKEK